MRRISLNNVAVALVATVSVLIFSASDTFGQIGRPRLGRNPQPSEVVGNVFLVTFGPGINPGPGNPGGLPGNGGPPVATIKRHKATLRIHEEGPRRGRFLGEITTDNNGAFQIHLQPGVYTIMPYAQDRVGISAEPVTVVVHPNQATQILIYYGAH